MSIASPGRRLGAWALDYLYMTIAVVVVFFLFAGGEVGVIIGLVWSLFAIALYFWFFRSGQTPGKVAVGIQVVHRHGAPCSFGYMMMREFLVKGIVFGILAGISFGIIYIVAAMWCLWDKEKQCLWDKITTTYVTLVGGEPGMIGTSTAPGAPPASAETTEAAENLRTLAEMRDRGLLSDAEYEERRQRELERL